MVMMTDERKQRSDAGKPRVERTQEPMAVSLQLRYEHPIEGMIARAIDSDVSKQQKSQPGVQISLKPIVIKWLAQHLGLIEQDGS